MWWKFNFYYTFQATKYSNRICSFYTIFNIIFCFKKPFYAPCDIASKLLITVPIILQGTLSRPPLCQGMAILQQDGQIYIGEEIGRWPTCKDLILTVSVNLKTGGTFNLFIPADLFDHSYMCNYSLCCLLHTLFSLLKVVSKSHSIKHTPSFDSSPV